MNSLQSLQQTPVSWWKPVVFAALAGGMGWGIRGQYGHETGAMIAGLLVSLTLLILLRPSGTPLQLARAVAIATLAMGLGGTMTYGQTVGLTHDWEILGNVAAWRWGMLGLTIKGGVWIGLAGAFLGVGLGGARYRASEMALLMLGLVAAFFLGAYLLNTPFDPANKELPSLYFSDHWHWEPDKVDMKPRRETWGGLWFALAALVAYTMLIKRDSLAGRMALWGVLGGALGFPAGQCVQSYRRWYPGAFEDGFTASIDQYMNWWNMMETTFGAVMGAVLGLGLWLNRRHIAFAPDDQRGIPMPLGVFLLGVHITLLFFVEFRAVRVIDMFYDFGLIMIIIPMTLCVGWRLYPYLQVLVVTMIPIAGKTVRQLIVREETMAIPLGWILYLIVPPAIVLAVAYWVKTFPVTAAAKRRFVACSLLVCACLQVLVVTMIPIAGKTVRQLIVHEETMATLLGWTLYLIVPLAIGLAVAYWAKTLPATPAAGRRFVTCSLLVCAWSYFSLNWAFFHYPWPWDQWTGRTPNGVIFTVCAVGLTAVAFTGRRSALNVSSQP